MSRTRLRTLVTALVVLGAALAVGIALWSGGGPSDDRSAIDLVGPDEAAAVLARDPGPWVVNVHVPYEGEIEGTDAFVPYDEVRTRLDEFPSDKAARLFVYCRSGSMSAQATAELADAGYTDIIELDGGMRAWHQAGYPLRQRNPDSS